MQGVRLVLLISMVALLASCSKSGKGGMGAPEDQGLGEGNIPVAEPGDELRDVNFAFDSSALSQRAQSILRENAQYLLDNPGEKVVVEGHCDERGTNEYNLALGERRARSAFDFLKSMGVPARQMSTISYGEELPLDPRSNESAWAKNRRVHFAIKR